MDAYFGYKTTFGDAQVVYRNGTELWIFVTQWYGYLVWKKTIFNELFGVKYSFVIMVIYSDPFFLIQ